jgi:O-antigen/teichoic acid export membrane protein
MAESRTTKVLILSSGQALTALVSLVSAAILTRILSKTDFGTYRQAMLAFTFAVPFALLGLDRALYAFLPGDKKRPRGLLVENLLLLTIAGSILSLFIIFGGNHLLAKRFNNPALAALLSLMVLYPLFMLPSTALSACLMSRNRTEQLAVFNVASRLIMLILIIIPCFILPKPSTALLGQVAGAIVTTTVAVYLMFRACPGLAWQPTWNGIKKQLYFSVPLGLSSIIGATSSTLGQVLVSLRSTPEIFAVYTAGAIEIPLIGIITGSITSVVIVDYGRLYKEGNTTAIIDLIHKAMTKSAILILPVMTFLFCIAPELMRLLFGKSYGWSAVPFRIYLLQLPMRTISFGAILQATGNSQEILIAGLLDLTANIVMSWYLIGVFGAAGAAGGSVLANYLVYIPYLTIVIRRILKIDALSLFPLFNILRLLIVSVIPLIIVSLLKVVIHVSDLIWLIIAIIIFAPVIIIGLKVTSMASLSEFKRIIYPFFPIR